MSVVKIWAHAVWATKYREPVLDLSFRKELFEHLLDNGRRQGIYVDHVNGWVEHVHVLMTVRPTVAISDHVRLLKGESSRWINLNRLTEQHFEWQRGFFACSVGEREIDQVRRYIRRQQIHHKKQSFAEEAKTLVKAMRPFADNFTGDA